MKKLAIIFVLISAAMVFFAMPVIEGDPDELAADVHAMAGRALSDGEAVENYGQSNNQWSINPPDTKPEEQAAYNAPVTSYAPTPSAPVISDIQPWNANSADTQPAQAQTTRSSQPPQAPQTTAQQGQQPSGQKGLQGFNPPADFVPPTGFDPSAEFNPQPNS